MAVLLTGRLAMWQFDRAEQKAALENSARAALSAAPVSINNGAKLRPYLRAAAIGKYLAEKEILIDNRVHNKTAGVHIITPLLLDGGGAIAVNRGWAKKNEIPPPPAGKITVRGVLQKDNADAFTLSAQTEDGNLRQNLDLQKYAAAAELPLLTLVLFTENAPAPAPVRTNFKSAQSIGYAWQWLTFCFLAIVFYIILGFKDAD
ncbi:MAG: SURF1 family protein [Betaproteobacteria bacterium]|nr:SURF1 family protein [Betaproteobacteria bacterium]